MPESTFKQIRFYILVVIVGIVAGLGAIVFRDLIALFHNLLFYGRISLTYDVLQHAEPSRWGMGIIFVPMIGAAIVAFLVSNYAPEAKGHGVPEVMDAIHYKRGIVRPIVAVVKSLASSISIGSGGSIGREGPIIQIGAAFGSTIGQWVKVADWERITLVACGAGGGIAATFNTPFGGILFAVEIMLSELSARTIIPVSIATGIATYVSYLYFGNVPFIPIALPTISKVNALGMFSYLILSILLGIVSMIFIRAIYFTEDLFDRIPTNYYVRHMLGMLIVGIIIYLMMYKFGHYYVQGVGYATVLDVLLLTLSSAGFLLFLACMKLVSTSITLGSGGSGGIFSPLLFIGATFGGSVAGICSYLFPDQAGMTVQLGAIAGMAGIVGASTNAPLTAIIMTGELINNSSVILPLMLIVMIAYVVRRILIKDSIYTLKLTRRGHIIPETHYKMHDKNK